MADNLRCCIIQHDIEWHSIEQNFAKVESLLISVKDVDLIVLPEMFNTGFSMTPSKLEISNEKTIHWFQMAAAWKEAFILGSVIWKTDAGFTNRLISMSPDGIATTYDKKHLFSLAGEHEAYESGQKKVEVDIHGWRLRLNVCYDLRFPVWSRNDSNYDALVYVANWPKPRIKAWDSLLKARAIENQSYVIFCNRVGNDPNNNTYPGHSGVIDYAGNEITKTTEEECVIEVNLEKGKMMQFREKLPFLLDRDHFEIK